MRMKGGNTSPLECKPYAYDEDSSHSPTTFCVVFEMVGYTYRYIMSVKNGEVIEEYLHRRKPKGPVATLFERSNGEVELGSSLRRKGMSAKVDSMMPYLSFLAINYDIDSVDAAFRWFLQCYFLDYSKSRSENRFYRLEEDDDLSKRVVGALNGMDLDITGIRYKTDEDDHIEGVYLTHEVGGSIELELEDESNGTKKLLSLLPHVVSALEKGTLVVSDEMDAKLHPKLLRYLIRLFTNPETNPNGAQLIFTSHDMSTLNSSTFRRDEIWFAAKNDSGSSELYSLSDIVDAEGNRIRPQNAYDRQYLAGQYGADPYLRNMLKWEVSDAEKTSEA